VHYDPVKDRLGAAFSRSTVLQRSFYRLLDLFFLRAWHVHKTVKDLFPPSAPLRVLDAGTGFGQYAWFLAKSFPKARILGVDVKHDYLDNARHFFGKTAYADRVDFAYEDLTDLKAEGPFDLIVSVDVMEHIEDDRAVFRHFARVLAPGGCVLINTPSDQGGSGIEQEGDASFIGEHVRDGYNINELQDKLRDAGLEPVVAKFTYGTYGGAAWKWMIQRPMQLLGKSMAFAPVLPLYYLPVLPAGLVLHALDVRTDNPSGTGLLVVARKPA